MIATVRKGKEKGGRGDIQLDITSWFVVVGSEKKKMNCGMEIETNKTCKCEDVEINDRKASLVTAVDRTCRRR